MAQNYEVEYMEEDGITHLLHCHGRDEVDAASKLRNFSGFVVHVRCLGPYDPQPNIIIDKLPTNWTI